MEEIEAEVVKLRLDNLGLQTQADRVWTIQEELEAEKAANTVTAKVVNLALCCCSQIA